MIVRCTRCGMDQRYEPKAGRIQEKSKRCVYCGRSFKVHADLARSRIVRP